jgi:tetratricopeptide (TPR) repeat protein
MHRRAGNSRKALEAFDRAIELNPRHEIARFNRGIVLLHDLDRPAEGLQAWEELAGLNPVFSTGDGRTLDELIDRYKANATSGNSN